ncbi:MAG: acetylglutamate kinase [Acidobacteriia bacterium]|nr:acetylglutamate kinase [Terriglobia bacterium]
MSSRIVVKIGGSILNDESRQEALVKQIAGLVTDTQKVVVVHGGGKALTSLLNRLDVPSHFHEGLRITNAETMDAALMTLAGVVNKKLVASFAAVGCRAIGLCGGDGGAVLAQKLEHATVDYGFVGTVSMINTDLIDLLLRNDYLPVISCVAMGPDHHYYNINADQMAAACAVALQADQLVFLTDVDGVLSKERTVLPKINPAKVKHLVADKVVTGGMLPKLNACLAALDGGVGGINILNGSIEDGLKRLIAQGEPLGTAIGAGAVQ